MPIFPTFYTIITAAVAVTAAAPSQSIVPTLSVLERRAKPHQPIDKKKNYTRTELSCSSELPSTVVSSATPMILALTRNNVAYAGCLRVSPEFEPTATHCEALYKYTTSHTHIRVRRDYYAYPKSTHAGALAAVECDGCAQKPAAAARPTFSLRYVCFPQNAQSYLFYTMTDAVLFTPTHRLTTTRRSLRSFDCLPASPACLFAFQNSFKCFRLTSSVILTFCRLSLFLCFYPAILTYPDTAYARLCSTNASLYPTWPHTRRYVPAYNVYNHLARADDQPTSFIVAHFFHFSYALLILRRHTQTALSLLFFYILPLAASSAAHTNYHSSRRSITESMHSHPTCVPTMFAHSVRMPTTSGRLFLLYPFASSFFSQRVGVELQELVTVWCGCVGGTFRFIKTGVQRIKISKIPKNPRKTPKQSTRTASSTGTGGSGGGGTTKMASKRKASVLLHKVGEEEYNIKELWLLVASMFK
ncbi:unnamed protein product [Ceratitis capitata]|uniref:(Mediterranean fruit fly) hypothetical protein n=1 Tax=Ceratitis capitata TaxID=7213 RepID=A0A811ULJ1_CERCA|nr:unnamed protein product [Ceratitis capitata]